MIGIHGAPTHQVVTHIGRTTNIIFMALCYVFYVSKCEFLTAYYNTVHCMHTPVNSQTYADIHVV
jgi:hypothetical protein